MASEAIPNVRDLALEARQIRAIQLGFHLFAAYLAVQLALLILTLGRAATAGEIVVSFGAALVTLVPGSVLQFRGARTKRWKWSSMALVATLALEMAALAILLSTYKPDAQPETSQPIAARTSAALLQLLGVIEFWWLAVIVAEFASACRALQIVVETEYLGHLVLGTVLSVLTLAAWTLPDPLASGDDFSISLQLVVLAATLAMFIWTFRLVLMSATLARYVRERMSLAGQQMAEKAAQRDEGQS